MGIAYKPQAYKQKQSNLGPLPDEGEPIITRRPSRLVTRTVVICPPYTYTSS